MIIIATDYEIIQTDNNPNVLWPAQFPLTTNKQIYKNGRSLSNLKANVVRAHREYWRAVSHWPVAKTQTRKIFDLIKSLEQNVTIDQIGEAISIVGSRWHQPDALSELTNISDFETAYQIWTIQDGAWLPKLGSSAWYSKIDTTDLNGDGFPDLLLRSRFTVDVFLNQANKQMKFAQSLTLIGHVVLNLTPACSAWISVTDFNDPKVTETRKFHCSNNLFGP